MIKSGDFGIKPYRRIRYIVFRETNVNFPLYTKLQSLMQVQIQTFELLAELYWSCTMYDDNGNLIWN